MAATLNNLNFNSLLTELSFISIIQAILLMLIGYALARITSRATAKGLTKLNLHNQWRWLYGFLFYLILGIFTILALQQLGIKLNVLLGAAGIITIALGFASQTSVSNIISGLFLIAEKPFIIGDYIKTSQTTGEVLSIDLLSIKIRTNDNTLVRIPNEILIKSDITNLTRFPIRRFDLMLNVNYETDIAKIRRILLELAEKNPLCLEEPKPSINIQGFANASVNLQFSVWSSKANFTELQNTIQEEIQIAFKRNKIEFPSRTCC